MNILKLQFIAQLPKSIGSAASVHRSFASDRGSCANTVFKRIPNNKDNCFAQPNGSRRGFQAWVPDKKDGYRTRKDVSTTQHIIDGFKMLKSEFKLLKEEAIEHLRADPLVVFRPGEFHV